MNLDNISRACNKIDTPIRKQRKIIRRQAAGDDVHGRIGRGTRGRDRRDGHAREQALVRRRVVDERLPRARGPVDFVSTGAIVGSARMAVASPVPRSTLQTNPMVLSAARTVWSSHRARPLTKPICGTAAAWLTQAEPSSRKERLHRTDESGCIEVEKLALAMMNVSGDVVSCVIPIRPLVWVTLASRVPSWVAGSTDQICGMSRRVAIMLPVDGRYARFSNHDWSDGREKMVSTEGEVEGPWGNRGAASAGCTSNGTYAIRGFMVQIWKWELKQDCCQLSGEAWSKCNYYGEDLTVYKSTLRKTRELPSSTI